MKSFKQFLNEKSHSLGTPVLILQGNHSLEDKSLNEMTLDNPAPDRSRAIQEYETSGSFNPHLHDGHDWSFNQTQDRLHSHYDTSKMFDQHFRAIREYTTSSYDVNRYLFEAHNKGITPERSATKINFHDMDGALSSTPFPKELSHLDVFSGVKFNVQQKLEEGNGKLFLPAYTSTSLSPSIADVFAPSFKVGTGERANVRDSEPRESHIIKMRIPTGHPGHFIGRNSTSKHEKEFIVARGTQLTVNPKPTILHYRRGLDMAPPSTVKIWHADANYIGPRYG